MNGIKNLNRYFNSLLLLVVISITPIVFADSFDAESGIYSYELSGGQKLYIKPIHQQKIVTIDTWVNVGSVQETNENNGLSHFLEHLLFKGTPKYPHHAIDATLGKLGAGFNAATSKDYTHYHITAASRYFKDILDIHSDMLLNADIPTEELNNERKVVQEEINRALDEPSRKMFAEMTTQMFKGHPYEQETLGPKKNITNIPRESILNFYHKWYEPYNFTTMVVGDVEPEATKQLVSKAFTEAYAKKQGKFRSVNHPQFFTVPKNNSTEPKIAILSDANVTQPTLMFAFPAASIQNPEDNIALDIATSVLGGGGSSRLSRSITEEKQLARSIGAGNYTLQQAGMLYFTAETTSENLPQLRKAILDEIQQFINEGPTEKELAKTQKQLERYFTFLSESTSDYSETLGYNVSLGKLEDFTQYLPRLKKTSAEKIRNTFKQYFDLNKITWVEMHPAETSQTQRDAAKDSIALDITEFKTELDSKNNNQITVKSNESAQAVSGSLPLLSKGKSLKLKANTPTKRQLSNGIKMIYKWIPDAQTIALQMYSLANASLLEEKAGTNNLASRLFLNGTKTRTSQQIIEDLETKGIELGAGPGSDYLNISGSSTAEDLNVLVAELSDILGQWTFVGDEYEKEKAYFSQELTARGDSPKNKMFENLANRVFPNSAYGYRSEDMLKALDSITPEDINQFYQTLLSHPQDTLIVIAGQFNPKTIDSQLKPITSLFKKEKQAKPIKFTALTPAQNKEIFKIQKPKQAATWIGYGWQGPTVDKPKEYAALKILSNLLGGGFTSRMFDTMRNKNGVAYETAAIYAGKKLSASMTAYIGTDPTNEEKVLGLLDAILTDLRVNPVDTKELEASKSEYIGEFFLAHEKVADQANFLGIYEALGAGFGYDDKLPKLIEKLQSIDIQAVAKKYLGVPAVKVIVAPQSIRTETEQE